MKRSYLQLLLLCCLCESAVFGRDVMTKVSTLTSTIPGSGMDSGFSFFGVDTGGGFELRICSGGAGKLSPAVM